VSDYTRPVCPVCSGQSVNSFEMDYAIPDGWTLPRHYIWKQCGCGFIWADTQATKADFNKYYRDHYDQHNDKHDLFRLNQLAAFIFKWADPQVRIVDYGGGDTYLVDRLKEYGFINSKVCNMYGKLSPCDMIVCSQIIEHIYDLDDMIKKFEGVLIPGGVVLTEQSNALACSFKKEPMIDFSRVNSFMPVHLDYYFARHGYTQIFYQADIKNNDVSMFRTIYQKDGNKAMFKRIKEQMI